LNVAEALGIPFQTVDLSKEYKARIVDYMFAEYENGRTPNPDVLCNREIKFDIFLEMALKLKADYVATGHYCQKGIEEKDGKTCYQLLAGADKNKDQSYFLCQLTQEQLSYALFPIGHLQKSEVREIANREGLITAEKKDSQGLCFVGKVRLPEFLQQQLKPKKGEIIEIPASSPVYQTSVPAGGMEEKKADRLHRLSAPFQYRPSDGEVVGTHQGAHYFTIGQRKGLNVGGKPEPLFVIDTDTNQNVIYVGMGDHHPGLNRQGLFIPESDIHWIRPDYVLHLGESLEVSARIRYRQPLQKATLYRESDGLYIIFEELQRGITPGQFAAWYVNDELLGSGVIS
ncbi:MAG: tRNA 2-thiouridine(34) synthase MnmA, partial [Bacteroidetes bacterium]|nr:tRNA 2-thiouridine(34) synthase MnmA [Bacteroidota bacterium]